MKVSFERVFMTLVCMAQICIQIVELIEQNSEDVYDNLTIIFLSLTIVMYVVKATHK